jgi:hypothetical protein
MVDVVYNLGFPSCAVLSWAAFVFKLPDLRRDWRNPALRAICVSLGFSSVAFSLAAPWIYVRVDQGLGVRNLATLVIYGSVVVLSASAQVLLLAWRGSPEQLWPAARPRLLAFGLALVAMVTLFLRSSVDQEAPTDFDARYAATPYVAEFLLVYYLAFTVGMAGIAALCWRYARMAGRPWLGRGLRLTAIGASFALGYCGCKGIYLVGRWLGKDLAGWNTAAPVSAAMGLPFLCIGLTIPAWGPRLSTPRWWVDRYRSYRELHPLWLALYRATPEIALVPPTAAWRDKLTIRDLDFRLYRRVIEIRDGRLALRPHFVPDVAATARRLGEAAGLSGDDLQATIDAATLAAALRAKARNEAVTASPAGGVLASDHDSATGADLSSEVRWLKRIARTFAGSPVVTTALAVTGCGDDAASDTHAAGNSPLTQQSRPEGGSPAAPP